MSFNIIFELYIAPSEQQHEDDVKDDIHILYIKSRGSWQTQKGNLSSYFLLSSKSSNLSSRGLVCPEKKANALNGALTSCARECGGVKMSGNRARKIAEEKCEL